jgi:hypothetical protein
VEGFFSCLFEFKVDKDLIFIIDPYFMGPRGMYLNYWTSKFYPDNGIHSTVLVWVHLLYMSIHYWNNETIRSIKNTLGHCIDHVKPRDDLQASAHICVEVDLENGLVEAIQLTLDN